MTQALINSLNIIEKTVSLADKMPKTEGLDFGKIFETKTNKENLSAKNEKQDNKILKDDKQKNSVKDNKEKEEEKTTNNKINSDYSNQQEITQTSEQKNTTDIKETENAQNTINTADVTTAEDSAEKDSENLLSGLISEEYILQDAEDDTDTNAITEEEPTMYKELNTLEDPTAVLLMQTQIHKTIKNTAEKEQAIETETNTNLKTISKNINEQETDSTLFKQFESFVSKDTNIVNLAPKEHSPVKSENSNVSKFISENIVKELNVEVLQSGGADAEATFSDLMQNQSPQEQAARVMIQGDLKYDAVEMSTAAKNAQVKAADITPSKIIEQIAKQLEGMFNNTKLNMVLNPGSLGKVNLQILNTKEGLMAQFTVTTQECRDLLLKGLDGLKESLLAHGVSVDNLSVRLEEAEGEYKSDYTEQEDSKQKHYQSSKQQKQEEGDFEQFLETGINQEENDVEV